MTRPEGVVNVPDVDLTRRELLGAGLGGGLALGGGKAIDNIFVGYGVLTGTNLLEQELAARVAKRFGPSTFTTTVEGHRLTVGRDEVTIVTPGGDRRRFVVGELAEAATADETLGLDGSLEAVVRDLTDLAAGRFSFAFSRSQPLFERVRAAEPRPLIVGALRGNRYDTPPVEVVRRFTNTDPAATEPMITGLAWGFREYSGYDIARYAAGSIEDNVLFGAGDLRASFRSPAGFEAMLAGENTGLFCYEFTYRSIEALHAVAPREQSVPVLGAVVTDARHKHVYTGIASAIREDGDLVIPMTFVDYTHSTLYDDLSLRSLLGNGIEAYDDRHRTTGVFWNEYARW